jgi:hypothetical protein
MSEGEVNSYRKSECRKISLTDYSMSQLYWRLDVREAV